MGDEFRQMIAGIVNRFILCRDSAVDDDLQEGELVKLKFNGTVAILQVIGARRHPFDGGLEIFSQNLLVDRVEASERLLADVVLWYVALIDETFGDIGHAWTIEMLHDDLIEQLNIALVLKQLETGRNGCVVLVEVAIDGFADFADGALFLGIYRDNEKYYKIQTPMKSYVQVFVFCRKSIQLLLDSFEWTSDVAHLLWRERRIDWH